MSAALGFRVKSGWATAVLLDLAKAPRVLDRRAIDLDVYAQAAKALGTTEGDVKRTVASLGRDVGGSWRADDKLAAAAAWMRLAIAPEKR